MSPPAAEYREAHESGRDPVHSGVLARCLNAAVVVVAPRASSGILMPEILDVDHELPKIRPACPNPLAHRETCDRSRWEPPVTGIPGVFKIMDIAIQTIDIPGIEYSIELRQVGRRDRCHLPPCLRSAHGPESSDNSMPCQDLLWYPFPDHL